MAASLAFSRICLSRSFPLAFSAAITPSVLKIPTTSYATSAVSADRHGGGKHWKRERIATVALVGLIPMGFIYPNPVVDYGLALLLPLHNHWGMESVLEDYVAQSFKKVAYPILYCISIGTAVGLLYLNIFDVGICNAVKMLWSK